jgi:hypothetical protein
MIATECPAWIPKNVWTLPLYSFVMFYGNQPTTCPYCGVRSESIFDLSHSIRKTSIEKCLNPLCGFEFVMEQDV